MMIELETMGAALTVEMEAPTAKGAALGDVPTIFLGQGEDSLAIAVDDVPALIEALQVLVAA